MIAIQQMDEIVMKINPAVGEFMWNAEIVMIEKTMAATSVAGNNMPMMKRSDLCLMLFNPQKCYLHG